MTKLDAGLITSLPASDPGSAAVWGSKRINPRPQFYLCLAWSGCPSNDDDDDALFFSENEVLQDNVDETWLQDYLKPVSIEDMEESDSTVCY